LYKFGGSYIDTDDLAIRKMPETPNLICRSYDPHVSFYNNVSDNACIEGKYREIPGYDTIPMFPRNDCWLNWEKGHPFLLGLLQDTQFWEHGGVVDICGEFSWQSLTLKHCKQSISKIGIDWNFGLTLLYLYEDFVSCSSDWDMGHRGGEMVDIWNTISHDPNQTWGNWKVTKQEAMIFYATVCETYPYVCQLWLHSKDGKEEWFLDELDEDGLYSVSTWIYDSIRKMIRGTHRYAVDAVLYINLNWRPDRKQSILQEIWDMGFPPAMVHRISAIYDPICGHLGCGKSHVNALDLAIQNGWERVMILEDDFHFVISAPEFQTFVEEADAFPWDVLLLAKGHLNMAEQAGRVKRVLECTTTSGYIVKKHYLSTLRDNYLGAIECMNHEVRTNTPVFQTIGMELDTISLANYHIVRYGHPRGRWIEKKVSVPTFLATNQFFQEDPAPKLRKFVERFNPDTKTFERLGREKETIHLPAKQRMVRYGRPDTYWVERQICEHTIQATNEYFGEDPAYGEPKYLQEHILPKLTGGVKAIDQYWGILQGRDHFYIRDPVVGGQFGFESDTG
jgi:hypothetical protein